MFCLARISNAKHTPSCLKMDACFKMSVCTFYLTGLASVGKAQTSPANGTCALPTASSSAAAVNGARQMHTSSSSNGISATHDGREGHVSTCGEAAQGMGVSGSMSAEGAQCREDRGGESVKCAEGSGNKNSQGQQGQGNSRDPDDGRGSGRSREGEASASTPVLEDEKALQQMEDQHVNAVYDIIAQHFSATR